MTLVRREIQRLCPEGCGKVLYFENGRMRERSAYEDALKAEVAAGLLPGYVQALDAADFTSKLTDTSTSWDLIVYAHQIGTQAEPYDSLLASRLWQGQRAIVTDRRQVAGAVGGASEILNCAGARFDGRVNWTNLIGDGRLVDGTISLTNPGYPVATYGLMPPSGNVQATNETGGGGLMARTARGGAQHWFVDVPVSGLSRLEPSPGTMCGRTGASLATTGRMLP